MHYTVDFTSYFYLGGAQFTILLGTPGGLRELLPDDVVLSDHQPAVLAAYIIAAALEQHELISEIPEVADQQGGLALLGEADFYICVVDLHRKTYIPELFERMVQLALSFR